MTRERWKRAALAAAASLVFACSSLDGAPGKGEGATMRLREGAIAVLADGEPFTDYCFKGLLRPCLYPLIAPGGVAVTRAPAAGETGTELGDPHHSSLWLAHSVNGRDFWSDGKAHIENADAIVASGGRGVVQISARNRWLFGEELVLLETRKMTFRLTGPAREIDFDFVLAPAEDAVTFSDIDDGAFALRLDPALAIGAGAAKARNSEGVEGPAVDGRRARWIACSARIDGRDVTVALLDHRKNTRHPTWWRASDDGLVAANPFFAGAADAEPGASGELTVAAQDALRLRYRLLLMRGGIDPGAIEDAWQDFTD